MRWQKDSDGPESLPGARVPDLGTPAQPHPLDAGRLTPGTGDHTLGRAPEWLKDKGAFLMAFPSPFLPLQAYTPNPPPASSLSFYCLTSSP